MKQTIDNSSGLKRQRGAITMFSAVLILILLTAMVLYAMQVGVFEQRKSANETWQKEAFHIADAGIQQAKQFMLTNSVLVSSATADLLPDGTDGWLAEGRWLPCSAVAGTTGEHPCFAESDPTLRAGSYFYVDDPGDPDSWFLPASINPRELEENPSANEQVSLHALLCMLDIDRSQDPIVQGCTTDTGLQDSRYFMVTLMAHGQADCDDMGANCSAEARVSEKIGSFGPGGGDGGPGVPLTARTTVPPNGTVEIVPNPNGGGLGVPISAWVNANSGAGCGADADPFTPQSGSWSTCELHEFYGADTFPDGYKCANRPCSCNKNDDRLLSYAEQGEQDIGIDIVVDENFPCDIWDFTFKVPKANWQKVRDSVPPSNRLTDCSTLDENSFGVYWISGNSCSIQTNLNNSPTSIGSANAPVFLISAAADTSVSGELFGVLFVTDVEKPAAEFTGNGNGTIYGAAIMDADMKNFNGTFQIVYIENIIDPVMDSGLFGSVQGGWTDFHPAWR
ncbi:MAG: hypothetical protein RQ826_04130 [Xanthomonadales bacterium]|nr:hypothetical protein [Xanthomonadales bacterium]